MFSPAADESFTHLAECDVSVVSGFKPTHDALTARGMAVAAEPDSKPVDLSIVFIPRNRAEALGDIAQAITMTRTGGWIVVDGQKTDGIDAIYKQVQKELGDASSASRDHGRVFWLQRPGDLPDACAAWLDASQPTRNRDGFITAPGMFSHEGIDAGTAFLLENLPSGVTGTAADLGAGWGGLSAGLLKLLPDLTDLDLIEADHAAIRAAEKNITDPRARFHWADATRWTAGPYDLVVANPPFHVSRSADPRLGVAFIDAAARLLKPKGKFLMVANRQLPYEEVLERNFRNWQQVAINARYKIISAAQPRKAAARG